jgi:hypothetical protein
MPLLVPCQSFSGKFLILYIFKLILADIAHNRSVYALGPTTHSGTFCPAEGRPVIYGKRRFNGAYRGDMRRPKGMAHIYFLIL